MHSGSSQRGSLGRKREMILGPRILQSVYSSFATPSWRGSGGLRLAFFSSSDCDSGETAADGLGSWARKTSVSWVR